MLIALKEDIYHDIGPYTRLGGVLISTVIFLAFQPYGLPHIEVPLIKDYLNLPWAAFIFFTIAICSISNGMNLIDGANGLSGMTSISILISLAFLTSRYDTYIFMPIIFCLITLLIIFLFFNYPWGKIFLGDSGAYFLGFLISGMVIIFYARHPELPTWGAVLMLFYPTIEVIFSVIRKKLENKSPFNADPHHLHLKLFFLIHKSLKKEQRINNCLVMPLLSIIWLSPSVMIPWVYDDTILIVAALIIMSIIYCGLYWALPRTHEK